MSKLQGGGARAPVPHSWWRQCPLLSFLQAGCPSCRPTNSVKALKVYLRYLRRKNSNCCTAALAVYLLLFSASYNLHTSSIASGARYRRSACWGLRQRLVATWAEFQHSIVYSVTDQCRKRLEACINAESGHSEHLLWHCLPDIPVATHHNRFFPEPPTTIHNWLFSEPPTSERTQQTFSQMK